MTFKTFFKRPKLLPLVMVAGISLLALKGAGLFRDAYAGEAKPAAATAAAAPVQPASADPAMDDPQDTSASEVDVLTSLSKRRAELDAREEDLGMRANMINAAEQRVDTKIAQLKQLQVQLQALLQQRDAAEQKQVDALVKTYSAMKAKDAARIFNSLDEDVRLAVASAMKPDVLAPIMAAMDAEKAQTLTVTLAKRLTLPAPAPAPTLASLAPNPVPANPQTAGMTAATTPAPDATMPPPAAPVQQTAATSQPAPATTAPAGNPPANPPAAAPPAAH